MILQYTNLHRYFILLAILMLSVALFSVLGCKPFDKEIKQDEHIAAFRLQLSRVQDSIVDRTGRIAAYETIIDLIDEDKLLITPRKKNNLLIEGNVYLCNEYLLNGWYEKAIDISDAIIRIDSTSAKGYYKRGSIYQLMANDSLALLDYTKTLALNEDYTDAYYNRGVLYEASGMYDLALNDYTRAIKKNPIYIGDIYNNRGNVYLAENKIDKALSDYDKALSYDSISTKIYCNRAWAYFVSDDYDKALSDCNKVLSLDSLNLNAYSKRASIYERMKQYDEAIEDYKSIIKIDSLNEADTHASSKQAISRLMSEGKVKSRASGFVSVVSGNSK